MTLLGTGCKLDVVRQIGLMQVITLFIQVGGAPGEAGRETNELSDFLLRALVRVTLFRVAGLDSSTAAEIVTTQVEMVSE